MKFIHTSDWHLGQSFYGYNRDDEHRHFFAQLRHILSDEHPDALVVSGDIFHNAAPTLGAQRLFVEEVMALHDACPHCCIVITAGNHDSGSRIDVERQLWQRLGIHVIGNVLRREDGTFDPAQLVVEIPGKGVVVAAPYFHPSNYPLASADTDRCSRQRDFFDAVLARAVASGLPVVLMAHLAVEGCSTRGHEDEPVGGMAKDDIANLGEGYDYLALGHIHMPQQVSARGYYCGSPVPVSFSEDYDHYVNVVEVSAHGVLPSVKKIRISTLRRVISLPPEGAPYEEALKHLALLPDDTDCYVRLLVAQDDPLPADADDRARHTVDDKRCLFCEVRRKPRQESSPSDVASLDITDMTDFNNTDPLTIAKNSYSRIFQRDMAPDLIEMMQHAINVANKI